MRLEYDPNRSADIALIKYPGDELQYIIAPQELDVGMKIIASRTKAVDLKPGNAMPIGMMPVGTVFHCLELMPGRGAQMARSAGTSIQLIEKNFRPNLALVVNVSKEQRLVPQNCLATVGVVSNPAHKLEKYGKAGRRRWLGFRPHVRGTAMNPVDHPHGGGQGKTKGGRISCTPWGKPTKGYKTRSKRKWNPLILVRAGGKLRTKEAKYSARVAMMQAEQKRARLAKEMKEQQQIVKASAAAEASASEITAMPKMVV
jgi:large subunit ribosomal protein L2